MRYHKRITSFILLICIMFGVFAVNVSASTTQYVAGDINADGTTNMKDIVLLQQYMNGWNVVINDDIADVNWDLTVNMKDIVLLQQYINNITELPSIPNIEYQAHVQDDGWMLPMKNGDIAGTTDQNKRLEAIIIKFDGIQYRTHVSDGGWQNWKLSGETAGTIGEERPIEAIQIKLSEIDAQKYNVYYRLHIENFGWLDWASNGETAGSTGIGMKAEAIQIQITKKNEVLTPNEAPCVSKPKLTYQAHIQDLNWQNAVADGEIIGTTGQALRLEAFKIHLNDFDGNNGINYKAHVSDIGWQDWVSSGAVAGTEGEKKSVEAVQIKLSSTLEVFFDIYYRVHSEEYGWLGWAKNGEKAGTVGGRIQVEAMQIKLVNKNDDAPGGGTPFYELEETVDTNSEFVYPMINTYVCGNDWRSYYSSRPSRPYHAGIDIASSSGNTNIYSTGDGVVAKCGWNSANGNYVVIRHTVDGRTIYSFYAHLSSYCVSEGNVVNSTTKIGVMGNTGSGSAGAHLHFAFVDTVANGNYYGYVPYFTGDKTTYGGVTFYNPHYIVQNNKLP